MGKSRIQYDETFEELMFYKVIDIRQINSLVDIKHQLQKDEKIGFMKNSMRFIGKMLDTKPARVMAQATFDPQFVDDLRKTAGKNRKVFARKVEDKQFEIIKQNEQQDIFITRPGYYFDRHTMREIKVSSRYDVIGEDGKGKIVLRDKKSGRFTSLDSIRKKKR